jgi:hypothetical protein
VQDLILAGGGLLDGTEGHGDKRPGREGRGGGENVVKAELHNFLLLWA